ncbi:ERI1 exoribonuclease 2 [Borealophlyctis nickersoniae]|nr:ERI1 exoribonuclease 2 [Borealophlyctis nickersoniae]
MRNETKTKVKPEINPVLSDFCKNLTGITQEQVDNGVHLSEALKKFDAWLAQRRLRRSEGDSCVFDWELATWSDWDMTTCLAHQCRWMELPLPGYFTRWIDIKKSYRVLYERSPRGVKGSMEDMGLTWEGNEHSGIDDAKNTARLAHRMLQDGWILSLSERCKPASSASSPPPPPIERHHRFDVSAPVPSSRQKSTTSHIPKVIKSDPRSVAVTAPLCGCGKRSKKMTVRTPGKNLGRAYFGCTMCRFFQWY